MKWHANSPVWHPAYQVPCLIRTRDGRELRAMLIHLNPKYHTKVKNCDKWKVLGDKKEYIEDDNIVEWKYNV